MPKSLTSSILVSVVCTGYMLLCGNATAQDTWHLEKIELRERVQLKEDRNVIHWLFSPDEESDRFECRLFFAECDYNSLNYDAQKHLKGQIIRAFNGLRLTVTEAISGINILDYRIRFGEKGYSYSFNQNAPFSLWLESKVHLDFPRQYMVVLELPPSEDSASCYANPYFVIGIGRQVSP